MGVVVTLACAACVGRQGRDDVELVGRIEPVPAPPAHKAKKVRETPPPSGPARDLSFPPITRKSLDNGLEINVVPWRQLPVVYLQLVVRSGSVRDPARLPGVAGLVAAMLKEGSKRYSSAQIAETIEFLGASLDTSSKQETLTVHLRTLRPHLEEAFAVLADVVQSPRFSAAELKKLKKRELDRLQLQEKNPNFIASRTFYRLLYGAHPYARIDTTPAAVRAIQRKDLQRWHKQYVRPNNAFLVAVGDVDAATIEALCAKHWRRWKAGKIKALRYPTPSAMQEGRVVVVDRPDSVQSVIRIGNLAIARKDPDYVPLVVANQVLGGSAASRLFMDLRERQSLTYGAYSRVGEAVDRGTFQAFAS
ncbi:MAG: M16 family metallopeptidase, partial [Polyangiales bacterium]